VIAELLERHHRLDADALDRVKAAIQGSEMEHKRLNVIGAAIDEGEMLALASR
jgi:hypothetical protein